MMVSDDRITYQASDAVAIGWLDGVFYNSKFGGTHQEIKDPETGDIFWHEREDFEFAGRL
jgi:hypothetical protein